MKPIARVENITKEQLQQAFPQRKNTITDELVDIFNASQEEPEFQGESLLQTAITYESVMQNNKLGIRDYVDAIRFCAYLISVDDNITEAYIKAFSHRDFVKSRMGASKSSTEYGAITSAASRYRKENRAVRDILTLSQVPLELLFGGTRVKAVMVLADLMENARFDKDKINAAKELLAATKSEITKVSIAGLDNAASGSMMQALSEQIAHMATIQLRNLEAGNDIKEVQKLGVTLSSEEGVIDVAAQ